MSDPRSENCRRVTVDSDNLITGVELHYLPAPQTKFELIRAQLIDERTAQGQTVASVQVLDATNLPLRVNCYLAWPWGGWQYPNRFAERLLPGNPNYPYQHVITNKYNPSTQSGPLAIYIGDSEGNVLSDVIGGLGLPAGRHICFDLVFRERSAQTGGSVGSGGQGGGGGSGSQGGGGETGGQGVGDLTELAARLARIEDKLDRLSRHMGIGA